MTGNLQKSDLPIILLWYNRAKPEKRGVETRDCTNQTVMFSHIITKAGGVCREKVVVKKLASDTPPLMVLDAEAAGGV